MKRIKTSTKKKKKIYISRETYQLLAKNQYYNAQELPPL